MSRVFQNSFDELLFCMDLITATQAEGGHVREEKDIYIRKDVFWFLGPLIAWVVWGWIGKLLRIDGGFDPIAIFVRGILPNFSPWSLMYFDHFGVILYWIYFSVKITLLSSWLLFSNSKWLWTFFISHRPPWIYQAKCNLETSIICITFLNDCQCQCYTS